MLGILVALSLTDVFPNYCDLETFKRVYKFVKGNQRTVTCFAEDIILVDYINNVQGIRSIEEFEIFLDRSLQMQREFTWSEVSLADGEDGRPLYIVIDNDVYDVTEFIDHHAGGGHHFKRVAGQDASEVMRAAGMPPYVFTHAIKRFKIGRIAGSYLPQLLSEDFNERNAGRIQHTITSALGNTKDYSCSILTVGCTNTEFERLYEGDDPMADVKKYSLAEVKQRNGRNNMPVWVIYKDIVYDVTSYIAEHPGGDVITDEAGTDMTKAFEDVGHTSDAMIILKKYKIGEIVEEEKRYDANGKKKRAAAPPPDKPETRSLINIITCGLLG